jgi:hypothetical protein
MNACIDMTDLAGIAAIVCAIVLIAIFVAVW